MVRFGLMSFILFLLGLFVVDWLSAYVLFHRWLSINNKERW